MSGFFATFLLLLLQALNYAIFARVILSWVDQPGAWQVTRIVRDITEPIMAPLRRVIPMMGMMDFSPIVAILLLQVLEGLVRQAVGQ
ncbi:MAG: YggT family protein [Roseiflexaceae bacterium]|jgi:YggT family protein|nr:MAG: YggT family protein [Chloroflexota bacterium]